MAGRRKHYVRSPRGELLEEGRQTRKAFQSATGRTSGRQWKKARRLLREAGISISAPMPEEVNHPVRLIHPDGTEELHRSDLDAVRHAKAGDEIELSPDASPETRPVRNRLGLIALALAACGVRR